MTSHATAQTQTQALPSVRREICDAPECPAKIAIIVRMRHGDLTFCKHHFNQYEEFLVGIHVVDIEN